MKIEITGIENNIIIGCHDYEKKSPQPVIIDLIAVLDDYDWLTQDLINTTVNYDELIDFVKQILLQTKYNLLESLAQYIANNIMRHYPNIKSLIITLTKPNICGVRAHKIKVSYQVNKKYKVALALGSNATNMPKQQLITAIEILEKYISDIKIGGFYQTKPFGFLEQNNFYNTAIIGNTELSPTKLMSEIKLIEKILGKQEIMTNGPRIIDIDIIFFDDLLIDNNFLKIPHEAMHNRDFVLQPLKDVAPNWQHPGLKQSVHELYAKLTSEQKLIIGKC